LSLRIRDWGKKLLGTSQKRISWALGLGLVLFPIHNIRQPGIELISIPAIGTLILVFAVWFAYLRGKWSLGPKAVWIPLAMISLSIVVSGILEWSYRGTGTSLTGLLLFTVYLACRWLGKDVFKVFLIAIAIEGAFILHQAITHPGVRTGGFFGGALDREWTNYAMALRLMAFGTLAGMTVLAPSKRWWLLPPVVLLLVLTGAEETLLVGSIMLIALLVRRDWNKKLLVIPAVLVVLVLLMLPSGIPQSLYWRFSDRIDAVADTNTDEFERFNYASGHRLSVYSNVIHNISPVGHGYYITEFGDANTSVPHNVPMMITDQVGPVAAVAWVFVILYLATRTRYRYLFIGILAMSILDHAIWTQAAPWWWAAAGVATNSTPEGDTDRIFNYAAN